MGYIKLLENGEFLLVNYKDLYEDMVEISQEINDKYFESIKIGKAFSIKDISGTTFEEIFEEIVPIPIVEIPSLEERVLSLGEELAQEKLKNIQKDVAISQLGQELASLKLEVINMKGGV